MLDAEIYQRITRIFRDTFDQDGIVLTSETSQADIDGWDSTRQIDIILAVEQELGIRFTTAEIEKIECVGDLVGLVKQKMPPK